GRHEDAAVPTSVDPKLKVELRDLEDVLLTGGTVIDIVDGDGTRASRPTNDSCRIQPAGQIPHHSVQARPGPPITWVTVGAHVVDAHNVPQIAIGARPPVVGRVDRDRTVIEGVVEAESVSNLMSELTMLDCRGEDGGAHYPDCAL